MVSIFDFSGRRGALVPLLPSVYKLLAQNARPLPHQILWQQHMRKELVDICRHFLVAKGEDGALLGVFFYKTSPATGPLIYIEDFSLTPDFANPQALVDAFVAKLALDPSVSNAQFYGNTAHIKQEKDKEILKEAPATPWEVLGDFKQMANTLKRRYAL